MEQPGTPGAGGHAHFGTERDPAAAVALLERETCTMGGADGIDALRRLLEQELQAQVGPARQMHGLGITWQGASGGVVLSTGEGVVGLCIQALSLLDRL